MKHLALLLLSSLCLLLTSCGESDFYEVGVFNNTKHTPVRVKIQYPSPKGNKKIGFSMIDTGEFKSNQLNTKINPIPEEVKVSWENSEGKLNSRVIQLGFVPSQLDDGAIIFDIDEHDVSARFLNRKELSGEWEKRLIRKGY
jgi:hypothetical protein